MPQTVIPNKLSFIWVGPDLPERYAVNILTWADLNPQYEIHLWTEERTLLSNAKILAEAAKTLPNLICFRSYDIFRTFRGYMISIYRETAIPTQIFINTIGALPPLIDPALLYEELTTWKNYGAASDILRIWIIYHIGGIYMDLDTYPTSQPLPRNIIAPHGILLSEFQFGIGRVLITPILASAAENPDVLRAAEQFQIRFMFDYPEVMEGVRGFSEENQIRLQTVMDVREKIAKQGGEKTSEDKDIFHKALIKPTLERTAGIFSFVILEHDESTPLDEYSFQVQSNYWPHTGHESTWHK